jgi:GNAT superfamily N-acetyltransferase
MIRIRPAQLRDCNELVLLCHELGYATSAESLSQQLAQLQLHPDHAVFVAEPIDGEQQAIGGWVHIHLHCTLQEGRQAEIGGLVVSQALRGQGVGKQLMQQAEAWAQQQGCHGIVVRSSVQRSEAHQFYQRVGYREIKRSIVFLQPIA